MWGSVRFMQCLIILSAIVTVLGARRMRVYTAEDYRRIYGDIQNTAFHHRGQGRGTSANRGSNSHFSNSGNRGAQRPGGGPGVGNTRVRFGTPLAATDGSRPTVAERIAQVFAEPLTYNELKRNFPWISRPRGKGREENRRPQESRWKVREPKEIGPRLGLSDYNDFFAETGAELSDGRYRVKIAQKYRGIPVYSTNLVAEQNDYGEIYLDDIEGSYIDGIDEDISDSTPRFSSNEAVQMALQHNGHKNQKVESPETKLYIYDDNGTMTLAYMVDYYLPKVRTPLNNRNNKRRGHNPTRRWKNNFLRGNNRRRYKRWNRWNTSENVDNLLRRWNSPGASRFSDSRYRREVIDSERVFGVGNDSDSAVKYLLSLGLINSTDELEIVTENSDTGSTSPTSTVEIQTEGRILSSRRTGTNYNNVRNRYRTTTQTPDVKEPVNTDPESVKDLYKKKVKGAVKSKRPFVILNANTGQIIDSWDGATQAFSWKWIPLLSGNGKKTPQAHVTLVIGDNKQCLYKYPMGSVRRLEIYDRAKAQQTPFNCSDGAKLDYDFTHGASSPRNSAFLWATKTLLLFGRTTLKPFPEGPEGSKSHIAIEVHHQSWRAEWTGRRILLGDGFPNYLYPQSEPDIVAHEMAHVYTEYTSGLENRGESGAINEAYSDMTAVALLDELKYVNNPYVIGHTVVVNAEGLRDICDPNRDEMVTYDEKNPYPENYNDIRSFTDSHRDSLAFSKAFCILSKKPNWSIKTAFKVFTRANEIYWIPESTFAEASCGVVKAARDISVSYITDVVDSFSQVGVRCFG